MSHNTVVSSDENREIIIAETESYMGGYRMLYEQTVFQSLMI
jgi:hypothetical protein